MSDMLRLTKSFIARVDADKQGWPSRREFLPYFRKEKRLNGEVERYWGQLRAGKPVPAAIARAFVEYIGERRGIEAAEGAIEAGSDLEKLDGVLADLNRMHAAVTDKFSDRPEMYLHHPFDDPLIAAEMIVRCVGHKNAPVGVMLDQSESLALGESIMGREVSDYAAWLARIWKREFRSVMFAVTTRGKLAGVPVILPLKQNAFERLRAGHMADHDIGPDDLSSPTKYLYLNAVGEPPPDDGLSAHERSSAQLHCMLYQLAYFTRGLRPFRPVILTIASNPQYESRLRRHGYRRTGTFLGGTDRPIVLLQHPGESARFSMRVWRSYKLLMLMIGLYRLANRRRWAKEDRMR